MFGKPYRGPSKDELRYVYKQFRLEQSAETSHKACENLCAFLGKGSGKTVALYVSMKGEVAAESCVRTLLQNGWQVCLPRVMAKDKPLVFNTWDGEPLHTKDILNIPCSEGAPVTPDVVVVPLVAFDEQGNRLGMGAGYYDRTLNLLENVKAVGLGFDVQKAPELPCELHDKKLDVMITETKMLEIK